MNIWIAGKDLMKLYHPIKKHFTANQIEKILLIKAMSMLKKYGKYLK